MSKLFGNRAFILSDIQANVLREYNDNEVVPQTKKMLIELIKALIESLS